MIMKHSWKTSKNMIQGSITEAFAVQDGKEKEGNFATSMPTAPVARGYLAGTCTIRPPAWQIYISIRAEFKPVMGTRLAYWTERLQYFVQLNYPWPAILDYFTLVLYIVQLHSWHRLVPCNW